MKSHNKELVSAIRRGDNAVVKQLYKDYFHYTAKIVITNNGNLDDAKECFQEALLILFRSTSNKEFVIKTEVKHYLAGIVKNLWLKELARKKKSTKILTSPDLKYINTNEIEDFDQVVLDKLKLDVNYDKLGIAMNELGDACTTILHYTFFEKKKDIEIAPLMNYTLEFVRQKRRRCLAKLKKIANEL